jgi:hypothetical protein
MWVADDGVDAVAPFDVIREEDAQTRPVVIFFSHLLRVQRAVLEVLSGSRSALV